MSATCCCPFPCQIDVLLGAALGEVMDIARQLDLTAYDAAYLALAARHGVALAMVDERLTRACEKAGVELVE